MQIFISDLHLCETHPDTTAAFLAFLQGPARQAKTLWILGDLFEYWLGDDELATPFNAQVADALLDLAKRTAVRCMVGNRDFLLGSQFAQHCSLEMVSEPIVVEVAGEPTLLLHGDSLCTDDHAYQSFRQMVRNPQWQQQFLTQPIEVRRQMAAQARLQSSQNKREVAVEIMDANAEVIVAAFREHKVRRMIHGHTHRPARHWHTVDGIQCERWVLSDWHGKAMGLCAHHDDLEWL